jgi:predicted MFS family arabinose efflux permease
MGMRVVCSFFVSLMYSAQNAVILEQLPEFRGTAMSVNQAAGLLGGTLGSLIGGIVIDFYGFNFLGPVLGLIMFSSAMVFTNYVKLR